MSPTFLVLGGYGEMGRITTHDLFETTKGKIVVTGHDWNKAEKFARSFKSKRVTATSIDVRNTKKLAALMKKCDVVINCTQYIWNLRVMAACEIAKKPYLDLGGLFHMTKKQLKLHNLWKKKGLLAILGCGSTPGITNVLAAKGASLFDRVREIHIRFANYDYDAARHKNKKSFALPYSFETLKDEFTKKAAVLRNGKLKFAKAMTGKEIEYFSKPVGRVTEYYTLHSELATFPDSFKKRGLHTCSFKVSFPEDFIRKIKRMIKEKREPPEVKKKKNPHDIEYIRVRIQGLKNGREKHLILDCIAKSNPRWNAPAGSVDTGVPPSIIAQMIVNGKIQKVGVWPPEQCIDPKEFFRELEERGMKIKTKFQALSAKL